MIWTLNIQDFAKNHDWTSGSGISAIKRLSVFNQSCGMIGESGLIANLMICVIIKRSRVLCCDVLIGTVSFETKYEVRQLLSPVHIFGCLLCYCNNNITT